MTEQETVMIPEMPEFALPENVEQELTLLRGFRDLVAERTGYMFGAKALSKEMTDATVPERKAVIEANKTYKANLETWVKDADIDGFNEAIGRMKKAREEANTVRKPHMEKINPLRKGVKYIDLVAIPDSLKELGVQPQPMFNLSEWCAKAVKKK